MKPNALLASSPCCVVPAGKSHVLPPPQFDLTLPALQESTLAQLQDILQAADTLPNPYKALKAELFRQHSPNVLEQLNRIVYAPELGGQLPSQLMPTLLTHLPAGEPTSLLFKHLLLLRLPEDLSEQVSKKIERLDHRIIIDRMEKHGSLFVFISK